MPQVLTTNAVILCPHGGTGTSVASVQQWSVNGGQVLVDNDAGTLLCPFLPCPCVGYTLHSMGLNATQMSGRSVLLVTDFNRTATGLPLTMSENHQTFDDSTAAQIPNGTSAPPLPANLADPSSPVVVAAPPAAVFNSVTQLPATIPITFTLAAAFPLQWNLTLISEPTGSHQDLTSGSPGATPAPPGGQWSSPSLTVVLTLALPFLSALAPGAHHFFMTGVSQRGRSGFATATLTVS